MTTYPDSQSLFEKSKTIVPGGVHSPGRGFKGVGGVPPFIQSAIGAELQDVENRRYVDYCMSWGPLIFGHQDPETLEALQSALRRGWTYGTAEPYSVELATLITDSIPWVEKIRFVNSGTEAVMTALRLARAATGRDKILKFDGCYHGHMDSLLVRAGSGLADMATPDSAGVSKNIASETVIASLDDEEQLQKMFEIHGAEIAAVIIEAIPANFGLLFQRREFFERLTKLAKSYGALFILDEVITGFRVGFKGFAEILGIRPDLVTYGKIVGGGFPVGAFGGRADIMDLVAPVGPVYQAGTLSANPIAMVAGATTLRKLKKNPPYLALEQKTRRLAAELSNAARNDAFPVQVQSYSSIFWPVFGEIKTEDKAVRRPDQIPMIHKGIYSKLFHRLLGKGVYLAPSAFEVSFLSTAHTDAHLNHLVESIRSGINEILGD